MSSSWFSKIAAGVAFTAAAGVATPAVAQQDIPWTWNSNDYDAEAKFAATGEIYHGQAYQDTSFVDWSIGSGSGRWNLDDNIIGQQLNLDYPEGLQASLNVCQFKRFYPDDCSGKKYGIS